MYPKTIRNRKRLGFPQIERGFYSKKTRERLVEEGAMSNEEAGFMQGYEELFEESLLEDFEELV